MSAAPVFLAATDTATGVKNNITVSTENGVNWTSSHPDIISISDNSDTVHEVNGTVTLFASLRKAVEGITLTVDNVRRYYRVQSAPATPTSLLP